MWRTTDEFRVAALEFKETGMYCKHPANTVVGRNYWIEQARRCLYGHKRADGSWITGYHYFYLNFCKIEKTIVLDATDLDLFEEDDKKVKGNIVYDFGDFWDGDADYFHYIEEAENVGKHGCVIKTRRRGYSYKMASMYNRNFFLIPRSKSYAIASEERFLTTDGLLTKTWDMMAFIDKNTTWTKRRSVKNSDMHRRASKLVKSPQGMYVEEGFMSEIIGITCKNDPDKVRGIKGKLIGWEEAGKFPNLLTSWNIALESMSQDGAAIGFMCAYGTGGSEGSNFISLNELFNNGEGYDVHVRPAQYGKSIGTGIKQGFFAPVTVNRLGCMDKDGNSDIEKAIKKVEVLRDKKLRASKNPSYIARYKAERPLTPEEAMLQISGTEFPVAELSDHLGYLKTHEDKYKNAEYIGRLEIRDGDVKWIDDVSCQPIRDFPIYDKSVLDGNIIIYEMPVKAEDGTIPSGRYISGADPADDDGEVQTDSLLSMIILDLWTDRIVAEYTGRPRTVDAWFENARKLLRLYRAQCNYERNKKGMYGYFKQRGSLYLLAEEPSIVKDLDISRATTEGNNRYGTMATTHINKYGRDLINNWLVKTAYGEDEGSEIRNLNKLRSIPIIKELIYWNRDGNFDRVSAIGMLMILREDRVRSLEKSTNTKKDNYLGDDPFFDKWMISKRQHNRIKREDRFETPAGVRMLQSQRFNQGNNQ